MAFRLIDVRTLKLESINGPGVPQYAILSHTWEMEEISHQEMLSINEQPRHPATQKPGYIKIRGACKIARSLGLNYLWVDTCCIDQTSSADLSEAINSMFFWYSRAETCLAYLSDLPPNIDADDFLRRCKWFTRGWTLQELLAPQTVMFYNNQWEHIGSKSTVSLKRLLSQITNIDGEVLSNSSLLYTLPVAQKMSWASQRETTRPEDIAYCLLGIFDVQMPLLYGEGEENAFMRLQEEIIKKSNDMSIFAWGHPESTLSREAPRPVGNVFEDTTTFSTDMAKCCDLLASSPGDFSGCGNLVFRNANAPRNLAFSLTNNGLLLSRVKYILVYSQNCYLIYLHCYDKSKPTENCFLALKMIDAGLFIRLRHHISRSLFQTNEQFPPAYVITRITSPLRRFITFSHTNSIQICSPGNSKAFLHSSILEVYPQNFWDPSRLALLSDEDEQPLPGYCKLRGKTLALASINQNVEDVYLAWGHLSLWNTLGDSEFSEDEALWVRLYPRDVWERARIDPGAREEDIDKASLWEKHRLQLGDLVFMAVVTKTEDRGRNRFRIDVSVNRAT
jgi:hypothetical protein